MRLPSEGPAAAVAQRAAASAEPVLADVGPDLPAQIGPAILARFQALPADRLELLRVAAEVANDCDCGLYWVGGGVRDLALGVSDLDLDLVVDGDLAPYAERFAAKLGSRLHAHPEFLTAELLSPGGVRIDLARARRETYTAPASLPQVEPAELASDLARRDFTVNCLAIPLAPSFGGRVIDPCKGLEDLPRRLLRTLHPDSFLDDPTRILRGLEFEARFGFAFARETQVAAESAVAAGVFSRLSPARLGEALRRGLGRAGSAAGVLHRLRDAGFLPALAAPAERDPVAELPASGIACAAAVGRNFGAPERFEAAVRARAAALPPAVPGGRREKDGEFRLALLCLALDLEAAERARLARRLALPAGERDLLSRGPERVAAAIGGLAAITGSGPPSAVHALLGALTDEELAVVAAHGRQAAEWVRRECAELRRVRLAIGGQELLAAGVEAGPALGRALERTLMAKLDGRLGAAGELDFALRALTEDSGRGGGAAATAGARP